MASMWSELKRRNVVRVAVAYAVVAWLVLQVADTVVPILELPSWITRAVLYLLVTGFIIAVIAAWAYEITPEGIKKDRDVDRSSSITHATGRKVDSLIIGVLVLAVVLFAVERFVLLPARTPNTGVEATSIQPSIAVLPFVNISPDPDQEYFADGLSVQLMNILMKIPDLKVAGRTSSFAFKDKNPNYSEIGKTLGVQHVLEGSVRKSGNQLRVTAKLTKIEDGFQVWSEDYNRNLSDIFEIQDDVATAIARQLRVRLNAKSDRLTENTDAYEIYLESLARLNIRESGPLEVIPYLDRVLTIDPQFAEAHELKAVAYWMATPYEMDAAEGGQRILESAAAALELDPSLLVARVYHRRVNPEKWTWMAQIDAVETALLQQPENFNLQRALCYDLILVGYRREALQCAERMIQLEPLSFVGYLYSGGALLAMGQRPAGREQWAIAAELDPSMNWNIAIDHLILGEDDAAIDSLRRAGPWLSWNVEDARILIEGSRSPESGKSFLDEWAEDALASASGYIEAHSIYFWYLAFGYIDDYWRFIESYESENWQRWTNAEELLQVGFDFPETGIFRHPAYIRHAERTGLIDLWEERGPPDLCSKVDNEWHCN